AVGSAPQGEEAAVADDLYDGRVSVLGFVHPAEQVAEVATAPGDRALELGNPRMEVPKGELDLRRPRRRGLSFLERFGWFRHGVPSHPRPRHDGCEHGGQKALARRAWGHLWGHMGPDRLLREHRCRLVGRLCGRWWAHHPFAAGTASTGAAGYRGRTRSAARP